MAIDAIRTKLNPYAHNQPNGIYQTLCSHPPRVVSIIQSHIKHCLIGVQEYTINVVKLVGKRNESADIRTHVSRNKPISQNTSSAIRCAIHANGAVMSMRPNNSTAACSSSNPVTDSFQRKLETKTVTANKIISEYFVFNLCLIRN